MTSTEDLKARISLGFRTSTKLAHGAADKAHPEPSIVVPTVEPPAILGQQPPPPLPKTGVPPPNCRGTYASTSVPSHKTRVFRGGDEVIAHVDDGHHLVDPKVAHQVLLPESSMASTLGQGRIDDAVMDVYLQGKEKERAIARERDALLSAPLATPLPPNQKSTDQHCEMLTSLRAAGNAPITRYLGPNRATSGLLSRGSNVDIGTIREAIHPSMNASAARRHQMKNAEELESTMHSHFAPVDAVEVYAANDRYARNPVLHETTKKALLATSSADNSLNGTQRSTLSATAARRDDPASAYATTYGLSVTRPRELAGVVAPENTQHHMHGSFNVVGGVRLISHQCHHPRATGANVASPTDIVPDHFATTNQKLLSTAVGPALAASSQRR